MQSAIIAILLFPLYLSDLQYINCGAGHARVTALPVGDKRLEEVLNIFTVPVIWGIYQRKLVPVRFLKEQRTKSMTLNLQL